MTYREGTGKLFPTLEELKMKYALYINSHTDYPDLEMDCQAKSKAEAVDIFMKNLEDWDRKIIEENTAIIC